MNILHIIGGDLDGGAARGAYNLHKALLEGGIESRIFTNSRVLAEAWEIDSTAKGSYGRLRSLVLGKADSVRKRLYWKRGPYFFSSGLSGFDLRDSKFYENADIVHLHWINKGLVRLDCLNHIDKPIVWTLRDMWPMTGCCHYALDCQRYQNQCGKCVQLGSQSENDLSRVVFRSKEKAYPTRMHVVGVSKWISNCARESALLGNYDISTINNGIDTGEYRPVPKAKARAQLQLPESRKIILIGAHYVDSVYKGFKYFQRSIDYLSTDALVMIFGRDSHTAAKRLNCDTRTIGYVDTIDQMRLVYSAADVFVAPSISESFGKTIVEANACGTPSVCFDLTGQSEVVEHMVTGYKARPYDAEDLAQGIEWVLRSDEQHRLLSNSARERCVRFFDVKLTAQKYKALYQALLN